MRKLNTLFTWTLIEKELRELAEEKDEPLLARPIKRVKKWKPDNDELPATTLWSFPSRGDWAVHSPDYRGNWSPYIPRFIIRQYTKEGELVLDPMVGGGTTLIECRLLGRNGIGMDISPHAIAMSEQKLEELENHAKKTLFKLPDCTCTIEKADARDIPLEDDSVDLICTHPPYGPAIRYTASVEGDLSRLGEEDYLKEMEKVAEEFQRVLKPNRRCVILIGDYRSKGDVVPFGFEVFSRFKEQGFKPEESIIKAQHQDSSTGFYFQKEAVLPFRIGHEYLFVFRNEKED